MVKHHSPVTSIILTCPVLRITAISEAYSIYLDQGFLSGAGDVVTQQGIIRRHLLVLRL